MTTEQNVIQAELRSPGTKGSVRKARQNGLIPGVLYKKGEAVQIAVKAASLPKKHTSSSVVSLSVGGVEKKVLMREVQVDVLTDAPLHFDFQEVSQNDVINAHVPLRFVGLTREQEKEGSFNALVRYLNIKTKLSTLPESIDVDVSKLKVDESFMLFDLALSKDLYVRTGKGKNVALASLVKT
jgi:large subunit ribosomal protein L25